MSIEWSCLKRGTTGAPGGPAARHPGEPEDGFVGMSNVLLKIIVLSSREDISHEVFFDVFFDLLLAEQRAECKPDSLTILVR